MGKYIRYSMLMLTAVALIVSACKTDDIGEIGAPFSKEDGIKGTWEVSTVVSVDEGTPLKDEWDISKFYTAGSGQLLTITFDPVEKSYEVQEGSGQNYMGTGGAWYFDDPDFPSSVLLIPNGGDTIDMLLGATIREFDPTLQLSFQKKCEGEAIVTYKYTFNRVSN